MKGTLLNFGALGITGTFRTNPLHPPEKLSKMSVLRGHLAEVHHMHLSLGMRSGAVRIMSEMLLYAYVL